MIARYAQRLVVMKDGRILLDGPAPEVFAQEDVLAGAKLKPPVAFQVSRRLGLEPPCLTVEALLERLGPAVFRESGA